MVFSEDRSIEQPALKVFGELYYEIVDLFNERFGPSNPLGRETSSDVVLKKILKQKLMEFNPSISVEVIDAAIDEIAKDRSSLSPVRANQEIYELLKKGIKIQTTNDKGEETTDTVKVIEWNNPQQNHFLLASQMWITGELHKRRPDLVGFINGLPLIEVELKKFTVNVKQAYDDNLSDYLDTIPHFYWYNTFVILSNGLDSKIGTFSAPWEHFNEWKKISDEEEEGKVSLDTIIKGTCEKNRFIDILENFLLYSEAQGKPIKIIAKNHQYLGANKAIKAFLQNKEKKDGKIGVFWHSTGSGKSYSMIFFSNKIFRKIPGNYTFLVVTDRVDLDKQIYDNFEKAGATTEKRIRARSSKHLRKLLKEDHRHIFTLIHKFKTDEESTENGKIETAKSFPILSKRDDIIVICDEAHRTQYGALALNMRTALPNAAFIAFTATPLFAGDERTREVFGDYVSIYNFKQSVDDAATVPLYYVNRKPEVEVINKNLNPQIEALIEKAGLDEDEIEKLRKKYPQEFQIIINDTRLDIIAKDIVDHFMGRGYKGKAMVVSIDRFTAVKMYNKVQAFWKRKIGELEHTLTKTSVQERNLVQKEIDYMKGTDMAVVVSSSQNEIKTFKEKELDIRPHRKRMVTEDLDVKFKDPENPLRVVFVCAMWMTGFDAPPVSTIYLDKPIRNHTLMQTISRANRVFEDKQSGTIVDYYGILRNLNEALAIYGSGPGGALQKGDTPLRQVKELVELLTKNLETMNRYFAKKGIDPEKILQAHSFEQLRLIEQAVEAMLENDESKMLFFSILRLVVDSYTDLLPDPRANNYKQLVSLYVVIGETIAKDVPEIDLSDIERKIGDLIDRSIAVKPYSPVEPTQPIDLSKIDLVQIQTSYKEGRRRTEAEKLRSIINRKLAELLRENRYRIDFQERLERIVDSYNMGSINIEEYFQQLTKLVDDLQEEEKRHIREGLTEEELAVFDILTKPTPKLTGKEEQQVKTIARELLETLKEQKLVLDWKKKTRTRADVQLTIEDILLRKLPEPEYNREIKQEKSALVYQHVYDSYSGVGQSVYNSPTTKPEASY
jgi:type I restriction enzyme R subunit